jgi:hypothetical protein
MTIISSICCSIVSNPSALAVVQQGTEAVRRSPGSTVDEELAFLVQVMNRTVKEPSRRGTLRSPKDLLEPSRRETLLSLMDLLRAKYRDDPANLVRVLIREANAYRDSFADFHKERELFLQAEKLQEQLQIDHARQQLEVYFRLGENYLESDRVRSLDYFNKVLAFPLFRKPYAREEAFKELYTKAAIRVVAMAGEEDLGKLRFHPFAFDCLREVFGEDKTSRLSGELPDAAEWRARVVRHLEGTLREQPATSPLRPHLAALLAHYKNKPR